MKPLQGKIAGSRLAIHFRTQVQGASLDSQAERVGKAFARAGRCRVDAQVRRDRDVLEERSLAARIHAKLGRKNDVVRLWNGGSLNVIYTVAHDGQSGLLQVVNYAAYDRGAAVSAWVLSPYQSARIYTLDHPRAMPIDLHPASGGIGIYLPPFPVYAAPELIK